MSFINKFLRNRNRNGKFGHAVQTTYQNTNATRDEDNVISSILRSIHKSPFMKKVLYNAIGLTLMATSSGFAGDITAIGTGTNVNYLEGTKTYQITTAEAQIRNNNAFNAFKSFQIDSGQIANFYFHKDNVKNIVNLVKGQVNVQGIINTIKSTNGTSAGSTNKIGGNLYFLSANGVVIGSTGVVNTGSFYAIVPNEEFMKRFITDYDNETPTSFTNFVDSEGQNTTDVNYILNKAIVGYNETEGITLNPDGKITIGGKINTRDGIGLYAGGNSAGTAGIEIKNGAKLQVLSKAFQHL